MKTEIINARIEPALKASAEKILGALGMNTTDAISIFLSQVVLNKGLPFDVKIPRHPNKETRRAILEARAGKNMASYASPDELRESLKKKPARRAKKN